MQNHFANISQEVFDDLFTKLTHADHPVNYQENTEQIRAIGSLFEFKQIKSALPGLMPFSCMHDKIRGSRVYVLAQALLFVLWSPFILHQLLSYSYSIYLPPHA